MFDHTHYVPALKGKTGEFRALEQLSASDKAAVTPLIDVPPIPWDFETEAPGKSIDAHLAKAPQNLLRAWGTQARVFVDLQLIDPALRMANGDHPLDDLFKRSAALGLRLVPVTGLERDVAYQQAVTSVVARDKRGVAVRLTSADLFDAGLQQSLDTLLTQILGGTVAATAGDADIVVDLEELSGQLAFATASIPSGVMAIPHVTLWRTLTLLGGSFPADASQFAAGTVGSVPRLEWSLWNGVRALHKKLKRVPTFGDYGIQNPHTIELDMRIIKPSASIRYTAQTEWFVFRGRNVRSPHHGQFAQFPVLSQNVVAHPHYCGRLFSAGDTYIDDCANNGGGPGNLTNWVTVGTNHHLTMVVRQVASLPVI